MMAHRACSGPHLTYICLVDMIICMRTTLNINDDLMRRVKKVAADSHRTLTEVVEEFLRRGVAGHQPSRPSFKLRWVTVTGRIKRGVDLADRDSLMDIMDDEP
jgi:hypothetical protein